MTPKGRMVVAAVVAIVDVVGCAPPGVAGGQSSGTLPASALGPPAQASMCPPGMVEIQGGSFTMQSSGDGGGERTVTLGSFCIDKTEVTVAAYSRCVGDGNCGAPLPDVTWDGEAASEGNFWQSLCNGDRADRQDHPVNCVTWSDARGYCQASGNELPSAAQWEYVARVRRVDGVATYVTYPWGDTPEPSETMLNVCGPECHDLAAKAQETWSTTFTSSDGYPSTAPVGSFPAGDAILAAGRDDSRVHDLAGNVWELTSDWYRTPAPGRSMTDPPSEDDVTCVRGGGFNSSNPDGVRGASSGVCDRGSPRAPSVGFRCARVIH